MSEHIPSYPSYLQLDRLLNAQRPPAPTTEDPEAERDLLHHEELLFIITHQTMELWFKQAIADMALARDLLGRPGKESGVVPERDVPRACSLFDRTAKVLQHLTNQFGIIETMQPMQFLAFRDALIPASGFQSAQFREVEILAGLKDDDRIHFEGQPYFTRVDEAQQARLQQRAKELSVRDAMLKWLARTPVDEAFPDFAETFLTAYNAYIDEQINYQCNNPNIAEAQKEKIQALFEHTKADARTFLTEGDELEIQAHCAFLFVASYRTEPLLRWPYALIERALEFEEHFRLFRFRHARMVERMIGLRVGSGGSSGVKYLDATTSRYRIFGELLKATSFLVDRSRLPDVPNPDILQFRRA